MSNRKNPPAADDAGNLECEQANAAGVERGLADMKSGATLPHEAAMAEADALIDEICVQQAYLEERAKRADLEWFDRFMNRKGGEPPRAGDELPEGYVRRA